MNTQESETNEKQMEAFPVAQMGDIPVGGLGCFAVIAHKETGEVLTLSAKTKMKLGKLMQDKGIHWAVLGVFKGKQLNVEEKVSFSLS